MTDSILIVDDEEGIRSFLKVVLEREGYVVTTAHDGLDGKRWVDTRSFAMMITDLKMPGMTGVELLEHARREQPEMVCVILTAHGSVGNAVAAMKKGAFDYLNKPLDGPDELRLLASRALEHRRLRTREALAERVASPGVASACDPRMVAVQGQLDRVAPTDATVLLTGESGVGKEVAARRIHAHSSRAKGPFVAVNCAALTSELLASDLFGHERGAFTGASSRRIGRFELADGGTLFLDEVGELDPSLQAKLLRVLQERRFERLGGAREIVVDVRIVAATNRNLVHEVGAGGFRSDLYHRLAVFPVEIPALRDRPMDVEPLAKVLLERAASRVGRAGLRLSAASLKRLQTHSWPGNVRELANVLERAAILATCLTIEPQDLHLTPGMTTGGAEASDIWNEPLATIEREAIRRALAATGGHRKRAAERLGIGLRTLYTKLQVHGLE